MTTLIVGCVRAGSKSISSTSADHAGERGLAERLGIAPGMVVQVVGVDDLGGTLPLPTRLLLAVSSVMVKALPIVILATVGFVFAFTRWIESVLRPRKVHSFATRAAKPMVWRSDWLEWASRSSRRVSGPSSASERWITATPRCGNCGEPLPWVVDADDELMWTDDHRPPTPTRQWKPGETIDYSRTMFIPKFPYTGETRVDELWELGPHSWVRSVDRGPAGRNHTAWAYDFRRLFRRGPGFDTLGVFGASELQQKEAGRWPFASCY